MIEKWLQWLPLLTSLCTGTFTFLMAVATVVLALETRATRLQSESLAKHAAFRQAISEIAEDIANLHGWYPLLEQRPTRQWLRETLKFESVRALSGIAVLHPDVWQRAIGIMRNLKSAELQLKTELVDNQPEMAKAVFYHIDIYLKQLARYLAVEMKRAGMPASEATALGSTSLLRPAPWGYGDAKLSPEAIAVGMESQPIAPFSALPQEPKDPDFALASLAQLINEAHAQPHDLPRNGAMAGNLTIH